MEVCGVDSGWDAVTMTVEAGLLAEVVVLLLPPVLSVVNSDNVWARVLIS